MRDFSIKNCSVYKFADERTWNANVKRRSHTGDEVVCNYVSRKLPSILIEKQLRLNDLDKIFASAWLNDSEVICGTKCNKVCECFTNWCATLANRYIHSSLYTTWKHIKYGSSRY